MDEEGEPDYERFTYVDEHSCIGCTMCAGVAPSTFFMEDAHGRARVFRQQGDADETIAEAIATCPVNCIHYVPFAELAKLETRRRGQVINNAGRLVSQAEGKGVGTSHLVSGPLGRYAAMARISTRDRRPFFGARARAKPFFFFFFFFFFPLVWQATDVARVSQVATRRFAAATAPRTAAQIVRCTGPARTPCL